MFTALTPLARSLAMATILLSLAVAAGRAPAAQANSSGSGPVVCTLCPHFPASPTLGSLHTTTKDSVLVQGKGFSSWGGVDVYIWSSPDPSLPGGFAATVHTTAKGSDLTVHLPIMYLKRRTGLCLLENTIYVAAIDSATHLSSEVQSLDVGCAVLALPTVTVTQSLQGMLHMKKGTIHIWGHHYTPHTSVAVYLFRHGVPLLALSPATLTATSGGTFTTILSTGYPGCSDTLPWTTFALDQAANVASPLILVQSPCNVMPPFKG